MFPGFSSDNIQSLFYTCRALYTINGARLEIKKTQPIETKYFLAHFWLIFCSHNGIVPLRYDTLTLVNAFQPKLIYSKQLPDLLKFLGQGKIWFVKILDGCLF